MSGLVWSLKLHAPEPRPLAEQLPKGRLIELTAVPDGAQMTTAVSCLLHAQQLGETSAWVQLQAGSLYPPDLASCGVDLDALVIVQVPRSAGGHGIGKAAELLLRSGGFGFVVLDLVGLTLRHDLAFQGRLLGLAREHDSTLLLLTDSSQHGSFGPLVSLCIEPRRVAKSATRYAIEHRVRKDKSGLCSELAMEGEMEV